MNKRIISCLTSIAVVVCMLVPTGSLAGITASETPDKANYGTLSWEKSLGTGYTNSPTPPLVSGDYVYTYGNKTIYKFDKSTGNEVAKTREDVDGTPGYATTPLAEDSDNVYALTSNGKVVQYKKADLSKGWSSENLFLEENMQNQTSLICKDGYIYGGTWGADDENNNLYFCIDTAQGITKWKLKDQGNEGYYWAGAYIDKNNNYIAFGSDGVYDSSKKTYKSTLYSAQSGNKYTEGSAVIDTEESIEGQIRSTVKYYKGNLYFSTNAGYLYRVTVSNEGSLSDVSKVRLKAASVNTPVIDDTKGVLYVGDDGGNVYAYDVSSGLASTPLFTTTLAGGVKGEMLYSTEKNCLYSTYNKVPGGIEYIKLDEQGKNVLERGNLYTPARKNYCISPIAADAEGNLYYKNDSGYIMAIKAGYNKAAPTFKSIVAVNYKSIKLSWACDNISKMEIERSTDRKSWSNIGSSTGTTFIDSKCTLGKTYYYRLRGLCTETEYTSYSEVKGGKTVLGKPSLSTVAGKSKITVSWKKVSGATGYYIYRSVKKSSGYKKVKTIKGTKWTNTKLKKGKKYYYKIKAYQGKAISSYSNVSYKKVK